MAMVISILNITGGTGKTTTAYNLGAALAEHRKGHFTSSRAQSPAGESEVERHFNPA